MVDVDELASLDFVVWRRTGQLASRAMGCNQSTVSRRLSRCLDVFQIDLSRRRGEWMVPDSPLLRLERELHQLCRMLGHQPLRIEGCPITGPLLLDPMPDGWVGGAFDHVGISRPLQLLRDRVIDAWLCDAVDDLPSASERDDLVLHPLWRYPVHLHAMPGHPLVGDKGLSWSDVRRFPCLDIPAGYPRSRARLQQRHLGDRPANLFRYSEAQWEQRGEDGRTLLCYTPLNRLANTRLVPLDTPEPALANVGGLLCTQDLADHPSIRQLVTLLRKRLAHQAPAVPELERV